MVDTCLARKSSWTSCCSSCRKIVIAFGSESKSRFSKPWIIWIVDWAHEAVNGCAVNFSRSLSNAVGKIQACDDCDGSPSASRGTASSSAVDPSNTRAPWTGPAFIPIMIGQIVNKHNSAVPQTGRQPVRVTITIPSLLVCNEATYILSQAFEFPGPCISSGRLPVQIETDIGKVSPQATERDHGT